MNNKSGIKVEIIVDYNNDQVIIQGDVPHSKPVIIEITGSMKQIQGLLYEVLNGIEGYAFVSLTKIDEDEHTIIEEW